MEAQRLKNKGRIYLEQSKVHAQEVLRPEREKQPKHTKIPTTTNIPTRKKNLNKIKERKSSPTRLGLPFIPPGGVEA